MRFKRTSEKSLACKAEEFLKASDSFTSTEGSSSDSDYYELPADVAARLAEKTLASLSNRLGNSEFMSGRSQIHKLPHFKRDEIQVGKLIAHGGFAAVYEIKSTTKPSDLDTTTSRKNRFVMKNSTQNETTTFRQLTTRAKHLAMEAHFLSSLNHDHIIKLRGWSTGGLSSFKTTPRLDAFFLIFDHLPEILTDRIGQWADRRAQSATTKRVLFWRRQRSSGDQLLCEQLKVGVDIASAIEYLHDNRIIYRDIKPSNIGFDKTGTLKLFDFGLAVKLPMQDDLDQTYKFPGRAGTRRYMSPEVLLERPYNVKADVYSFSVLLWEILSLRKPKLPEANLHVHVPIVKASWPTELKELLKRGLRTDLSSRPHMKEVRQCLSQLQSSSLASNCCSKDS